MSSDEYNKEEVDVDEESDQEVDDGREEQKKRVKFHLTDFLENEAELSGAEASSDECDEEEGDLDEESDQDVEDAPEEQNKLAKFHLKRQHEDDLSAVRNIQEAFLPEGDLHQDGGGRNKKFRWSTNDDNEYSDKRISDSDSDDSTGAEESAIDDKLKWKKGLPATAVVQEISHVQQASSSKKFPVTIIGKCNPIKPLGSLSGNPGRIILNVRSSGSMIPPVLSNGTSFAKKRLC